MRKRLTVAALAAAATLFATGAPAMAGESASPSSSSGSTSATSTQLERVSAYTQPSVVYIGVEWTGYVYDRYNKRYLNNDKPFVLDFQCTGYVVNPDGYIATAGHCVDPEEVKGDFYAAAAQWAIDNGYYKTPGLDVNTVVGFGDYMVVNSDQKKKPDLKVTTAWSVSAGGVDTGKSLPARVVKRQSFEDGDGAILKVEADNLNALPLSEASIDVGTEVVAIGYPATVDSVTDADLTPSYKEGSVSAKSTLGGGLTSVYEVSAATSGGMSGGPAVSTTGEVIGFVDFKPADESQSFNFIRPTDTIRELLGDAGTTNQLSDDTQAYRAGLDAYFSGNKATAVSKLQSVVDDQPTNDIAKQYLDKAKKLPDPPKKDEGGGAGLIIGIVIALIVLAAIAGLIFFLLSRNKKTPAGQQYGQPGQQYGGPGQPGQPGQYGGPGQPGAFAPSTSPSTSPSAGPSTGPNAGPGGEESRPVAATPAGDSGSAQGEPHAAFCPGCGTKAEPGQKFCKNCGHAV